MDSRNLTELKHALWSWVFVRGRGMVFRRYYKRIAKSAGKDDRDGAVVRF